MVPAILDTHHAIVGSSGGGKTVTAKAEVEQLLADRRHLAVIDPTGVWYGLRSNAAGDGPGFDIPITVGDGATVAGIIVDQRISAVIDLSEFYDDESQRAFLDAFARRLRNRPRENFHLYIDEADLFCPQPSPDPEAFALTQVLRFFAKRSRVTGLVLTLITQRPADIDHTVLSQSRTIIAHNLLDPRDRRAIDRYVKDNGDAATRKRVAESLPRLAVGERWIYSPALGILECGVTAPIATFDSSRTPAAGERRIEPKLLGQIDVSAIRNALATKLQSEDADSHPGDADLTSRVAELEAENAALRAELISSNIECDRYVAAIGEAHALLERVRGPVERVPFPSARETRASGGVPEAAAGGAGRSTEPPAAVPQEIRGRRALVALVDAFPAGLTEKQWATLAGLTQTGGTWSTYRSALKAAGLVEPAGPLWYATPAGVAAIGAAIAPMPPIGTERARYWGQRIPGVRRMVDVLIKRWPHDVTRAGLAADLGMAVDGGTFGTYLGRLRANGLVEEAGKKLRLHTAIMGEPK